MRICAVIPVFNNVQTIGEVVRRCRAVIEPDVLAVSDGSTDGSDREARQAGAMVRSLSVNKGKGRAIREGLKVALDMGYTHAIVLDADGQHLPEEIPRLLDAVWSKPNHLWVCVRRMQKGSTPKASRRGRSISNFWTTLNGWQRCLDAQSGYRCYPIAPTLKLGCREDGYAFEMEVLVRASWAGLRISHLEVDVVYPKTGDDRVTHFDPVKDNVRASWLSFKMFWSMLARSPVIAYNRINLTRYY
jgi:glycosyltransferase involved in cell wall biosynthesis